MENAQLWGAAHAVLFALWLAGDLAAFAVTSRVKNALLSYEARARLVRRAATIHILPRVCFALILVTGVELTGVMNVYPLSPGLRAAAWIISGVWVAAIVAGALSYGKALAANLRIVELIFEAFTGLAFVAYGLNSLATGAPIDDPWFAVKLFLFGLVFWAAIAADVGFRPFYAPFSEIAVEGSTPEREEAIAAAINHALAAMVVMTVLVLVIAVIGRFKPF